MFLLQDEEGEHTLVNLALAFEIKAYENPKKDVKDPYMKNGLLVLFKDEAMDDVDGMNHNRKQNRMSKDIHCHRIYYGLSFNDLVLAQPFQMIIPDHLAVKKLPALGDKKLIEKDK